MRGLIFFSLSDYGRDSLSKDCDSVLTDFKKSYIHRSVGSLNS